MLNQGYVRKMTEGMCPNPKQDVWGERDLDVDPVESQALTWLTGSCGPSHSPALFVRTPSFIGASLVPNSETESSIVLSVVLNRERGVTGGRVG